MSFSVYIIIVMFVTSFMNKVCREIDLKDRKITNTVIYLIGYLVGCVIMAINCYVIK